MDYAHKISTLQERAIIQLAINLSQGNSFKELALCLAKPTYGYFSHNLFFVSDQYDQDQCSKIPGFSNFKEQLDVALDKECRRLTEELPHLLRDRVRIWMNRIALEYQSYRCRLELLFGVSRYFLMTILSIRDWKETGRLDEKKVAVRLLEDKRLTFFQKYQIACVFCLHAHIPELWKRLTEEEISLITEDIEIYRERIDLPTNEFMFIPIPDKKNILVLFWSDQMITKDKVTERELWTSAAKHAIYFGNRAALAVCWESLNEQARQQMVVEMALRSLLMYIKCWPENRNLSDIEVLEEISWLDTELTTHTFNLRSHYAELMLFFLSQMDEEQKLTFFKRAFSEYNMKMHLQDFLDWPLQDVLLQMVNRLRGIIKKDIYGRCMISLAQNCSFGSTKENHIDEYRSLFWKLWETTPEELKQYILNRYSSDLLYYLLQRSPFLKEDQALFNRVFSDLSQECRRKMMRCEHVSSNFIAYLLEEGRWPFLNWFLEECLSKEEISSLKKKFLKSVTGCNWFFEKFRDNRESLVEDVIDWCFEFDSEKSQFKWELINSEEIQVKNLVCFLLMQEHFAVVERIFNFCESSDEVKKKIKADYALWACKDVLKCSYIGSRIDESPAWKKMDKLLTWSLASGDEIRDIKKYLLYEVGVESHFDIAFLGENWGEVERFYKWFDLSPVEIEDHKDIIFNDMYLNKIATLFLFEEKDLITPLRWFLSNEEKVMRFKERLERRLEGFSEFEPAAKESLDYLESELLRGLRKEENQSVTSRGGTFVKNKGEKRSSVEIDDESSSQSKRCMKVKSK